jgi:hypothetical protein
MILQNCYELLCELGQIESYIQELQGQLNEMGIECNDEDLLRKLVENKIKKAG